MIDGSPLKAPFPYFGGKSRVAERIWQALGQPGHYIEPFFGSGAVLLARPGYNPQEHVETVCDKDGYIANVWRALQSDPDAVAKYCDWPVNHADLAARRSFLIKSGEDLLSKLVADDGYCDVRLAGYWIWSACSWIGAGMMDTAAFKEDSFHKRSREATVGGGKFLSWGTLVKASIQSLCAWIRGQFHIWPIPAGGVHSKSMRMDTGPVPHMSSQGQGIHSKACRFEDSFEGILHVTEPYNIEIYHWFRRLSERLRDVRVVCGDWSRVCGCNWHNKWRDVGIFFDPPYAVSDREVVYSNDDFSVAHKVREWAIERAKIEGYKIVIAGYDEHDDLAAHGWTAFNWRTSGGYGNVGGSRNSQGRINAGREVLWLSPSCFKDHVTFTGWVK